MFGLDDKDIEKIRLGTWELPCPFIELKKSDGQPEYSGAGIIRQNEKHQLKFTLIDNRKEGFERMLKSSAKAELKAGQIVPAEHFYRLLATDTSGRCWIAEHLLNLDQMSGTGEGVVVEGVVHEISCCRDVSSMAPSLEKVRGRPVESVYEQLHVNYRVFSGIEDFPCNAVVEKEISIGGKPSRRSSSFSVANQESELFSFVLMKDDNGVKFTVDSKKSESSYPNHPELRFAEALQFALGQPFDWEILNIAMGNYETCRVRPRPKGAPVIQMQPPIRFMMHQHFKEFWTLFKKYLDHVWSHSEDGWHPISRRVLTLQYGSSSLWPIRMLTAGVEVEGLLKDHYDAKMPPPEGTVKAVDEVLKLVEDAVADGTAFDAVALERIRSSLGHVKSSSSARNKLVTLASQSVVRRDDVEAWEFVRNKAAHAVASETEMTQDNFIRLDKVLVLFYHLIFHLIGYQGVYTDYGELGHPEKTYPPEPAKG